MLFAIGNIWQQKHWHYFPKLSVSLTLTFTFATGRCIFSGQVHPFAILALHHCVPYQYQPFWTTDLTSISFKLPSALLNKTIRHGIFVGTPLSASQHLQAFFSFLLHFAFLTAIDWIDGYGHWKINTFQCLSCSFQYQRSMILWAFTEMERYDKLKKLTHNRISKQALIFSCTDRKKKATLGK